jgi:hypothetical protein
MVSVGEAGRPLAWVVYESMFGNTRRIAEAIAEGLLREHEVVVFEVSDAPDVVPDEVALLVVGGPTHGFQLSSPRSREQAKAQAGGSVISERRGLREWIEVVELRGRPSLVCFDTKVGKPRWFWGSAAKRARRLLEHKGALVLRPPEHFYVHIKAARPSELLYEGELDRAKAWGESLGPSVAAAQASETGPTYASHARMPSAEATDDSRSS